MGESLDIAACSEWLSLAPWAHHGAQGWHARTTRKAHRTCQSKSQEMGGARNPAWALLDLLSLLNN